MINFSDQFQVVFALILPLIGVRVLVFQLFLSLVSAQLPLVLNFESVLFDLLILSLGLSSTGSDHLLLCLSLLLVFQFSYIIVLFAFLHLLCTFKLLLSNSSSLFGCF